MNIILADTHGPILGKSQGSPNLGLLYIAAYAKQFLNDLSFVYIPQKYSLDQHISSVRQHKPRFYAISFTSYGANQAFEIINLLKIEFPDLIVICGGPHPTASPKNVLEKCKADIVVIGEGEETFVELINNESQIHDALPYINGIAYLDHGNIKLTPPRTLIQNLDDIPLPDRSLVVDSDFVGLQYYKDARNTEMIITRGCPFRCVFCANPVFRTKDGPLFRKRSPKAIAEEAEQLYQNGFREIYLHSDELNISLSWSIQVCKELAALGHEDLFFQCHLRAAPISNELAYWLKKANFWLVRFGIESSSQRVLKGIKKQMSREQTDLACLTMTNAGIKVLGYFTLYQFWENQDGILEAETTEEVMNTITYAHSLWKSGHLHYIGWMVATPVHGAELYDIAKRHGFVSEDYVPGNSWTPSQHIPDISLSDYKKALRAGRLLQAKMALSNGSINFRNWRGISTKLLELIAAKRPQTKLSRSRHQSQGN